MRKYHNTNAVAWGHNCGRGVVDNKRYNSVRHTKPHPPPLPEEGGEGLAVEMKRVVLGLFRGGDVVDNEG